MNWLPTSGWSAAAARYLQLSCGELLLSAILALALAALGPAHASERRFDFDNAPGAEPITPVPAPQPADPLQVALGERLFADPRLSHGDVRSCQTCHNLRTNGANGKQRATALDGTPLPYETLTIFNSVLNFRLSWEGHFRTPEAQVVASLTSPNIMGTTTDEILDKLRQDPRIVDQFKDAFGHGPDSHSLVAALVVFENSLLTPGSRFDLWLAGDASALSAQELSGYRLFKSLGCIACHQGVNVGGNLFERRGIYRPVGQPQEPPVMLRVPSLRNVATTAPYFHDGSAPTLADAVRKMSRLQLYSSLSDSQVEAIVAYLCTLTGNYRGRPVGAPR
jgi:cytochrome c peroxidase